MTGRAASRCVRVVAEERVVGETVAAALADRGFDVVAVAPPEGRTGRVGLLLAALDTGASLAFARAAIGDHGVPWVVVVHCAGEPDGDRIDELNAAMVLRSDATIPQIESALDRLLGDAGPED
ncbi:hypothetical protein [Nocardioides sp. SR21]|uniref:hypothetical protein n=1 Tax=Nocardioides sp. SR21 TaxID=2919501 RepID=UPI001FAA263B|nr:hypothetical protein [Nocardioides sp. SR21]